MASFLEKLKKGMDIKEPVSSTEIETKASQKKSLNQDLSSQIKIKTKMIKTEKKEATKKTLLTEGISKEEEWLKPEGELGVDVYQTDKEIIIQAPIAGVKGEDLDISIENDILIIKGKRERPFIGEIKSYFYQECYWGPFSRKIVLPEETDISKTEAHFREGILTITIPKIEREKKKKIVIKEE